AFFGIAMVSATWIVAEDWYLDLGMYSLDRLELIQIRGGTIMWAISEVPTVGYAILVAVQWMRSDDRRARQYDRKAERDGGAELAAYNAYLASLRRESPPAETAEAAPADSAEEASADPADTAPAEPADPVDAALAAPAEPKDQPQGQ